MRADALTMSLLYDYYGELLTEKQRQLFDLYYDQDYSLSEIAAAAGISRQGVYDAVRRGESQLMELEEKLGLQRRHGGMVSAARRCREALEHITPNECDRPALDEAISILDGMSNM